MPFDTETDTKPYTIDEALAALRSGAVASAGEGFDPTDRVKSATQRVAEMPEFRALLPALSGQESGDDSNAVSPKGARGIYQIMPANIGPWGMDTVGRYVTKEEYDKDPKLQRAIGEGKLAQFYADALERTKGNPRLAAHRTALQWYTGKPVAGTNYKVRQGRFPSPKDYVSSVLGRFDRAMQSPAPTGPTDSIESVPPQQTGTSAPAGFPSAPPEGLFPSAPGASTNAPAFDMDAYVSNFDTEREQAKADEERTSAVVQRIQGLANKFGLFQPAHTPLAEPQSQPPAIDANPDLMQASPRQLARVPGLAVPEGATIREGRDRDPVTDLIGEVGRTAGATVRRIANIFGIADAVRDVTKSANEKAREDAILKNSDVPAIVRSQYAQALEEPMAPESSVGKATTHLVGDLGRMGLELALTKKVMPAASITAVGTIDAAIDQIEPVATNKETVGQAATNVALAYGGFKGFEKGPALAEIVSDVESPIGRKAAQIAIQGGIGASLNLADASLQGKMPEATGPLMGAATQGGLEVMGGDHLREQHEAPVEEPAAAPDAPIPTEAPLSEKAQERSVRIDAAAHEAATSPVNDRPDPTSRQLDAGNYKKGHVTIQGLDISIENPAGSERGGIGAGGKPWKVTMQDHYGYIKGSEGADGEHVDAFIGPDPTSEKVFVVDQVIPNAAGAAPFDEHKVVLGARSKLEATRIYKRNFSDDATPRIGAITELPIDTFKQWLAEGKRSEPMGGTHHADDRSAGRGHPGSDPELQTDEALRQLETENTASSDRTDQSSSDASEGGPREEVAADDRSSAREPISIASEGKESYLRLANGEKKPVRYALVEAKDVQLSHDAITFERNPDYAGENQNDYQHDLAQQQTVIQGGRDLDTEILHNTTTTPTEGPTIVDRFGQAAGGNGRGMMLRRAYDERPAETKNAVIRDAQRFGLDPAKAAEMEQPAIVRVQEDVVGEGAASNRVVASLNQTMTKQRAPVEEGVYLAKQLEPEDRRRLGDALASIDSMSELTSRADRAEPVLRLLREKGQITGTNQNQFVTSDGTLTDRGREMVEGVALGMALPDAQAIAKLPASVRERLTDNLRPLALAETLPGWELHDNLARIAEYLDARNQYVARGGMKEAYDRQTSLVGEDRPPLTDEDHTLLALLEDPKKSKFREFMMGYGLRAEDARIGAIDMSGRAPVRDDAFNAVQGGGDKYFAPSRSIAQAGRVAPSSLPAEGALDAPKALFERLSLDLGKRFLRERLKGSIGAYDKRTAQVSYRFEGDLDTLAHEVGHDISFALSDNKVHAAIDGGKYDRELEKFWPHGSVTDATPIATKREEGVAEYMRAWMVNPIEAEIRAPEFARVIEDNVASETLASLRKYGDELRRRFGATSAEKTASNIQMNEPDAPPITERLKQLVNGEGYRFETTTWDKMQAALRDALWPAIKGSRVAAEMRGKSKLMPEENPEILFRDLVYGAEGKYAQIYETGQVDPHNNRYHETYTAHQLLDWVRGETPDEIHRELNDAASLLISERVVEKAGIMRRDARLQSDEVLAQAEAAAETMKPDEARQTLKDAGERAAKMLADTERKIERLSGVGAGMESDFAIARRTIEELRQDDARYTRLREGARRYRVYADNNLRYLVESGRLSEGDYDAIKSENQYYADMHRVLEAIDGGSRIRSSRLTSAGAIIKGFRGSTRLVDNPWVSLFEQTRKIYAEADRNRAMLSLRNLLTPKSSEYIPGLGEIGSRVEEGTPGAIKIWVNGKTEAWKFEAGIERAMNELRSVAPTALEKALAFSARVLRSGTVFSPAFNIAHRLRIAMQGAVSGGIDVKPWNYFKPTTKADRAQFYLAGGKVMGGYYEGGAKNYQSIVKEIIHEQTGEGKLLATFTSIKERVHKIYDSSDLQPRVTDFSKARRYAKNVLGYDDYNASLYAAFRARDVLDFAVSGHFVKEINRYIPFLNAAVQGIVKNVRAARENPASFAMKWGAYMVAPALVEYGYNMSVGAGDDWRSLPSYQRDRYFNFKIPGYGWLKIPKPWELGVLASGVPRMIEWARNEPHPFDGYWHNMLEVLLPVKIEQLVQPVLVPAVLAGLINKDPFRDRPIVPYHELGKDLSLRNTERSTRIGKWLGPIIGADPRQIDYAISAGGGGLGSLALAAGDIGREDRPSGNVLRRFTGLSSQPTAWQSPDVVWVQQKAVEIGREQSREFKELEAKLKASNEATNDADRERLSREAIEYAKQLRTDYEQHAAEYLSQALDKKLLREQMRSGESGADLTDLPVR